MAAPLIDATLAVQFDVPQPVITEHGHGQHLAPSSVPWAGSSNVQLVQDVRGFLLYSYEGDPAWKTTTSGFYSRKSLSDFTQTVGTWVQVEQDAAADHWLSLEGTAGTVTTAGTTWSSGASGILRANPHICIRGFLHGIGNDTKEVLRVTWGNAKWRLSIFGNGAAQLYRDTGSGLTAVAGGQLFKRGPIDHAPIFLFIRPLFRRCVYIEASGGGLMVYEDKSLDTATTDYTATLAAAPLIAAGTLAVQVYARAQLQITEVRYLTTGVLAATVQLPYQPTTGIKQANPAGGSLHWYDTNSGTVVVTPAATTVPSGTTVPISAAIEPPADRLTTPVIHALGFKYDPAATTNTEDNTAAFLSITLPSELTAHEERSNFTLRLKNASAYKSKLNRRLLITMGGSSAQVWTGHSTTPEQADPTDNLDIVTFECDDPWKKLDKTLMPSCVQYDGWLVTDAIKDCLSYAGIGSSLYDIDTSPRTLPSKGTHQRKNLAGWQAAALTGVGDEIDTDQEPAVKPQQGQSVGDFIRYLRDTYLTRWRCMDFSQVAGTVKFRLKDQDNISKTPVVTLYKTIGPAVTAGKDQRYVVTSFNARQTEPEATEIYVVGTAPGGKPLIQSYTDFAAEKPDTAQASRPTNWVGEKWRVILIDASLTTQTVVNLACSDLAATLTHAYEQASIGCHFLPYVRRWDWVRVMEANGVTYADFYVLGYSVKFNQETAWNNAVVSPKGHTMELSLERKL